ncbi:helix-turn-helix domain-containing protein [Bacteroides sp.]
MNYLYGIVLFLCYLPSLSGTVLSVSPDVESNAILPDSLLTEDYLYEFTFSDVNKAHQIINQMRARKKLPTHRLDIAEGDLYFNTGYYYQALPFYKRALQSDSVQMNSLDYMEQLHRMISSYDCLHNDEKKMQYIELLLKKSQEVGNQEMQSVAYFNMGKTLYYQADKKRGYHYMKKAIKLMEESDYKYKYDNLRYNYNTLFIIQERDKQYQDALETLLELQKVIRASTDGEPAIENLEEKELKTLYANFAVVLSRLNRLSEAEDYYKQWKKIGKAYDKDNYLIMPYLFDRKMYDEIIRLNTTRENFLKQEKDTISYHMTSVKRSLARVYEAKGDYKQAARYFKELALLHDSIKVREQKSSALELGMVYDVSEKEMELSRKDAELKLHNSWLIFLTGMTGLLLIFLWRSIVHSNKVKQKNRSIIEHVNELLFYQTEWQQVNKRNKLLEEKLELLQPVIKSMELPTDIDPQSESKQLFAQLNQLVTDQKLFLKTELSRDDFAQMIHVNKTRFAEIIKENTGTNLTDYLNNLRIEHAIIILQKYPEYTLQAVATEAGFNSMGTFYSVFQKKIGMKPTEYRNMLKEMK